MARGDSLGTMRDMVTTTSMLLGTGLTLANLFLGIGVVLLAVRLSHARRDQPH